MRFAADATNDSNDFGAVVQKDLAPDAVLETPVLKVQGVDKIQDVLALHSAFAADSQVGDIKWDDE